MPNRPVGMITTESELRALIPPPASMVPLKKLSALEQHCRTFLSLARVGASATRRQDGSVGVALHGGAAGFVGGVGDRPLPVPVAADEAQVLDNVRAHGFAGFLFLIPGVQETLRVNGRATAVANESIDLAIEEAFLHCPKAFIRAHLWDPAAWTTGTSGGGRPVAPRLDPTSRALLERVPFWFLGTCRDDGHADVAPRGDPPGALHVVDDGTLLVPDRPGNRLLDNYGNVLALPTAGLLCLVPGDDLTLSITGRASLVADPAQLTPMTVQGKPPLLALRLDIAEVVRQRCGALQRARVWDAAAQVDRTMLPTLGRMVVDQVEPGGRLNALVAKGLDLMGRWDGKKHLY